MTGHDQPSPITERIILFGSEGGFSRPVLVRLLEHNIVVAAVVMSGVAGTGSLNTDFPMVQQPAQDINSLAGLAAAHAIPVLRTQDLHDPQLLQALSTLAADLMLLACFPCKLPPSICTLPGLACWNLHPSLLPRYRGPAPLFWQLRNKEHDTGVSLHEVTDEIDAGDIIAQHAQPLPDCTDTAELDEWVADIGVALLLEALHKYHHNELQPLVQDEALAAYFPFPGAGSNK